MWTTERQITVNFHMELLFFTIWSLELFSWLNSFILFTDRKITLDHVMGEVHTITKIEALCVFIISH